MSGPALIGARRPPPEIRALTRPTIQEFDTAPEGLAAEMDLLGAVAAGSCGAAAFLWAARTPWLVLPERFSRTETYPKAAEACALAGWPVATRRTGGGITPQGPGVLNLALAFRVDPSKSRSIRESYAAICDPLVEGLGALGITSRAQPVAGSFCDGDYNLAVAGRKIVGTAQRWRANTCLCHALILTEIDLPAAVAAVQKLSAGLGHADRFDEGAHGRLADLAGAAVGADLAGRIAAAIWSALETRGYAPYRQAPTNELRAGR